jgi:hypothetical protein
MHGLALDVIISRRRLPPKTRQFRDMAAGQGARGQNFDFSEIKAILFGRVLRMTLSPAVVAGLVPAIHAGPCSPVRVLG